MKMMSSDFYHQLVKDRRMLPCPSKRLYGDLLPMIFVDASIPREYTVDTRAKCNTLTKQMEKTVRTYYMRKQQVLGHIEGERRELYKQALALHRAMVSSKQPRSNNNSNGNKAATVTATTTTGTTSEFTLPPFSSRDESTRFVTSEQRQQQTTAKSHNATLPSWSVGDLLGEEKFFYPEDDLLPPLTPDQMDESQYRDYLKSRTALVHTVADSDDVSIKAGSMSHHNSMTSAGDPQPSSGISPIVKVGSGNRQTGGKKKNVKMAAGVKLLDDVSSSDDVFTMPSKSRWPKIAQQIADGLLEPIAEVRTDLSSSMTDSIARRGRRDTASLSSHTDDSPDSRHSVKITIKKAGHQTLVTSSDVETNEEALAAMAPLKKDILFNNKGVSNYLLRKSMGNNKTAMKMVPGTTGENYGQTLLQINKLAGPIINRNAKQNEDESKKLLTDPRNRRKIIRVRPLVPGKSRFVDWQLEPATGLYKSRIVIYEEPHFNFDGMSENESPSSFYERSLRVAGRSRTMMPELISSREK